MGHRERFVKLNYDKEQDLRIVMGETGRPETGKDSDIVETYQHLKNISATRRGLFPPPYK